MSKKNRRKIRKALATMLAALLLVVVSVGATVAYLTSETNTVTNTFTYGKVGFKTGAALDEAKVTEYGVNDGDVRVTSNVYKLMPGHNYVKDPTVHMSSDTENAWLFVKVVNGIAAIEKADVVDNAETPDVNEAENNTIAAQMKAKGWVEINAEKGIYAYSTVVTKDQNIRVFDEFTLADDADVDDYTDASITIQAYAVQADGLSSYTAAWTAAPLNAWLQA